MGLELGVGVTVRVRVRIGVRIRVWVWVRVRLGVWVWVGVRVGVVVGGARLGLQRRVDIGLQPHAVPLTSLLSTTDHSPHTADC